MKENRCAEPRLAQPGSYEQSCKDGEKTLLTVSARWPRLEETAPGLRRINRYYDALAQRWIRRWEGPLLDQARSCCPAEPWQARLDFTLTLFRDGLMSLYLDATEEVGQRRPRRVRQGDVWSLPGGAPVTLRELLPHCRWWRAPVLAELRRQIGGQIAAGESAYYEDWLSLVSRRFSPQRFYLTEAGPVVFYPVQSIAPAMEGFPTFSLSALLPPPAENEA